MLNNFFYSKSIYLGKEHHIIRYATPGKYGQEFTPLTIHMKDLIDQGQHQQTIRVAGPCIANFVDYMNEGLKFIQPTQTDVNKLYRLYHSYLTTGEASASMIVRRICQSKPSPLAKNSTSKTYHGLITPFLRNIHQIQKTYDEYITNGLAIAEPEISNLIDALKKITATTTKINDRENAAIWSNSAPTTTITGSKTSRSTFTSHIPYEENFASPLQESQYFPLDKISELISNASSHRNACLYALIAATNARDSEADQILWSDINIIKREVLLIDPTTRQHPSQAYQGISELERNKLEWKGRGTPLTLMLEPYGSLFFYHLEQYMRYEYNSGCGHNFIFHDHHGRPLYLCDYSSVILHQFKIAAKKTLPNQPNIAKKLGLHSLRHSNIFFLKNYIEHSNGQGLSDSELLLLTGHIDMRSLQKYAKVDWELLMEKISYANHARKQGTTFSSTEFQIQYLEERLSIFKEKLKQEQGNKNAQHN
ncbi:phage integrase family protein [Pantoea sp. Tr-811]|uniref:tyrosine-type recombinase/integrase n=1 Tax=Pantoea sp. Tr-811 TaxID=2608361 RepID=UPI001422186F|nr:tyrosine-type recombinase/integrase [Pantoea sp. Tr-811]NIF29451.1 phage integrase family protein [Pantoea sp. Tr-811]